MNGAKERIVLLLEVEDTNLSGLVSRHSRPGVRVLVARTEAQARRILESERVAVVIAQEILPLTLLEVLSELTLAMTSPPSLVVIREERGELPIHEHADYVVDRVEVGQALSMIIDHAVGTADLQDRVATSEQQYRDLIEASNDAIYIFGDTGFAFVNPRFTQIFGYSAAELTQSTFDFRTLVHPDSRPLVEARVAGARRGQPLPTRYEFKALRRDKSAFDVEVSVAYITYHGRPAVLGILQDITARKAYEKALLRKNHELSVLNAVAEAITQVNDLGSVLDGVMERLIELLGVDAAGVSILDDDDPQRFAWVHYRGCSETFIQNMRARIPTEGVLGLALATRELQVIDEIELDDRISKGAAVQEGFRSAVALPVINQERCSGVITIFTRTPRTFTVDDIRLFQAVAHQLAVAVDNARLYGKAQEGVRRLEALSEITRAIGSTLDVEGVFQIAGERLVPLVSYQRIAMLIARQDEWDFSVRLIDRAPPGEAPRVQLMKPLHLAPDSPLQEALHGHRAVPLPPGDVGAGEALGASPGPAAVVPIQADHTPMGLFLVMLPEGARFRKRDLVMLEDLATHLAISLKNARIFEDLEAAYLELRDAKDRLVRSEKLQSLGEMAAGVAHDFNNVLSAILGRAQMLKVILQDDEVLKSLRVIEKAALDGAGTVRRIQEFAKAKSDRAFIPVALNPLVREVVERCATRADGAQAPVEREVELQDVPRVMGNPSELREVLTNLIFNALDAMPHGGRLAVRTGYDPMKDRAWVEVEDTGIGMTPEVENKIFDPFFSTKGEQGTGLGMSVSYGIVQRHKGEFVVRSARGKGTTIRVLLPPVPTSLLEARPLGTAPGVELPWMLEVKTPAPFPAARLGKSARILVIDDDVAVREVLADILRAGAHEVVAAGTGSEGIALFEAGAFDVVFTDLGMPGMSGWEVARGIKTMRPGTPVGLITGWGASLDEAELADHGVDLIIPKPFRFDRVLELVDEAIRLKERLS